MKLSWLTILIVLLGCSTPKSRETRAPANIASPHVVSGYCMAIRGNGQNLAAHWIAMARVVEKLGMPAAVAGGSSASISLFLLDSLAGNKMVNRQTPIVRKQMQALLLKSMPEYLAAMLKHDKISTIYSLISDYQDSNSTLMQTLAKLADDTGQLTEADIRQLISQYGLAINPELLRGLTSENAVFYKQQILDGVNEGLNFDAAEPNLFFRPALVDFRYLALVMGVMGDLYAGNVDSPTQTRMTQFLTDCTARTLHKALGATCAKEFDHLVDSYLGKKNIQDFANQMIFEPVGVHLAAAATTAVVQGNSLQKFMSLKANFDNAVDKDYKDFYVAYDDLKFGYYGQLDVLDEIQSGLSMAQDYKSKNFLSLGEANWITALSTSPAEPGLAPIQPIPVELTKEKVFSELNESYGVRWTDLETRGDSYSAGGWSDLTPTLVLKAYGCSDIAYMTRQGGETTFGQQTSLRLVGENQSSNRCQVPFWQDISKTDPASVLLNNNGRNVAGTSAACSSWNQLWNRGNPDSSTNVSLAAADVVVCTNWDAYTVPKDEQALLANALTAPIVVTSQASPALKKLASHAGTGEIPAGCAPQP